MDAAINKPTYTIGERNELTAHPEGLPGALGLLDVLIDDQPATISGSVAERDRVTGRVMIVALKWPLAPDASVQALLGVRIPADEQGRFQIGGLAPGEYRVAALTEEIMIGIIGMGPDTLIRVLGNAEKVTLERGSSQSLSLKLADPPH